MNKYLDHLIIGNGIAGVSAAEEIRKRLPGASIAIVSDEPHPCYSRVLLPHYLKGKIPREKVFIKSREWYATAGISVFWGQSMVRLDPRAHEISLEDGTAMGYGQLLLSSGGRVKALAIPGGDHAGVLPLRTLDDAERIRAALDRVAALPSDEQDVAIVGGGFIGLEFPTIFSGRGFRTHLCIRGPHYWANTWDAPSAAILESTLTNHGVALYKGVDITTAVGDNSGLLKSIQTSAGATVSVRLLGYGVGLLANREAARAAGIKTNLGIIANEYLETNEPDVYAAGDVAEFFDATVGRQIRLGNWINAVEQGRHAGARMAGERRPYLRVSQYTTTVFDCVVSFIGDVSADSGITVAARGAGTNQYGRLLLRDGKVRGATLVNRVADRAPIVELIRRGTDVLRAASNLADPSFDLKNLL